MKTLLTGADGLLGSNVVRELIRQGFNVRVLVERGRNTGTLDGLDIEKVEGNILDKTSLAEAVSGCDFIIHAAASTSIWPPQSEIIRKVNIEGTRNLVEAAIENKVKRIVHVGTANSFGAGTKENPGDESSPFSAGKYKLDYIDSKYKVQQILLNEYKKSNTKIVIVNPTFMLGPFDSKPSSGQFLLALYQKQVPGYTKGGRNFLYVKDAAVAVVNALTKGRPGECYILAGTNLTYKEFNEVLEKTFGIKPPKIRFPKPAIMTYGVLSEIAGKVFGFEPKVSRAVAKISNDLYFYNAKKAVDELDLPQTPIETAVKDAIDWFKKMKYIN
ncbi:MAG: NAD-dependent epimerase/dehydratase family protein [Prolixibacteraceae bacterium]|nr:NAD-dependent epimerase/dehydratase family protein [Prolixibacteraceae bacterium]